MALLHRCFASRAFSLLRAMVSTRAFRAATICRFSRSCASAFFFFSDLFCSARYACSFLSLLPVTPLAAVLATGRAGFAVAGLRTVFAGAFFAGVFLTAVGFVTDFLTAVGFTTPRAPALPATAFLGAGGFAEKRATGVADRACRTYPATSGGRRAGRSESAAGRAKSSANVGRMLRAHAAGNWCGAARVRSRCGHAGDYSERDTEEIHDEATMKERKNCGFYLCERE